jgi:hypothetical protein
MWKMCAGSRTVPILSDKLQERRKTSGLQPSVEPCTPLLNKNSRRYRETSSRVSDNVRSVSVSSNMEVSYCGNLFCVSGSDVPLSVASENTELYGRVWLQRIGLGHGLKWCCVGCFLHMFTL